jgi:hypothetical protein
MLFSLKDLASKLSPNVQGKDNLHTIKTNSFTLHHFESLSGLVFVLNTDSEVPSKPQNDFLSQTGIKNNWLNFFSDMNPNLQHIYSSIYTECISRNPLYQFKTDEPLNCPLFVYRLEEYLLSLPQLNHSNSLKKY